MNAPLRCALAALLLLAGGLGASAGYAQDARVIVKYKPTATAMKRAAAVDRARSMSGRLGVILTHRSEPAPGLQALSARAITTAELVARLAADPDVEYAVPDRLRHARALPNDPLYLDQWYLQSVQPAAIRADAAWDTTTGSSAVVVAVADTGVRPEHPDLSGRLLAGYDFISDAALAGDGDGRDPSAADNGDFISPADQSDPALQAICGSALAQQNSSWHGTRVSGVIAATGNNSQGISGLSWSGRVLPLRVLGKCGGFDSDIIAAMRWAGGIPVGGVPANSTPAQVINLSLGGPDACSAAYQETIDDLAAAGVLVVASAGNETGPVEAPANCRGVLAVAGVRHVGTKVGYSSLGTEVGISAPAGNCVNSTLPCVFPINTTTNSGSTAPAASTYTDGNQPNIGTSFSAPQVAGVAALMLAVNPALTPAELIARIKASARAFPVDPAIPTCPTTATEIDTQGQCNCTTSTCGAGLLDAAGAVAAAAPPEAVIGAPAAPTAGSTVALDAGGSSAAAGRSIVAWAWSLVSAPAGAALGTTDTSTTTLQAPVAGAYVIRLVVTDNLGASDEQILSLQVAEPAPVDPGGTGNGGTTGGGTSTGSGSGGGGGGGNADPATVLALLAAAALVRLGRGRTGRRS